MSTTMKSAIAVAAFSPGVPMPEAGSARLEAWPNTVFFGSAVQIGELS